MRNVKTCIRLGVCVACMFVTGLGNAQSLEYNREIMEYRDHYRAEFLEDKNSPLNAEDTAFLRFYPPNKTYRVNARFEKIQDDEGFDMHTHSGIMRKYYVYGKVRFSLFKRTYFLYVYQSDRLRSKPGMEKHLFIPFTDDTNYRETFGGGRYIDCSTDDIKAGILVLDFNKAYNPYCAFKGGYHCPIPPKENDLKVRIAAGEKLFGKAVRE